MKNWKTFWQNYRVIEIKSQNDLLYQVGKTVGGSVISEEQFKEDINEIIVNLDLKKDDVILDLCCGNGVLSYKLSNSVEKVIGVDFSQSFIENAKKHSTNKNISYYVVDVLNSEYINKLIAEYNVTKVLMNDCLAYFEPKSLDLIISKLSKHKVTILMSSILDKERKWHFYNTLTRKINYILDVTFYNSKSGIGYWWTKNEIQKIADKYRFEAKYFMHHNKNHTAHYRFNVRLKK
ncbi:class I SAM-dependent methyltransferase [Formosa maritima]|uniref:Class I SAM-dependent methyltransferase n=1 Tax=Formosa maritima TaxID=2592046 RepID=A0A5D0GD69_9FLAO|nr:class I SAM-dependent methyltransferase [Formosa maritima]TYA56640.1 class I SAM-dependent methyltransferase [Formosa maritima]